MLLEEYNFKQEVLDDPGPVLVDFWAAWCGPCRVVAPVLEEIASERPELRIVKLNTDENPQISAQFQVLSIPTMILFKGGQPVDRIVGYVPEAARTWITPDLAQRFSILRADLNSLADYETRLQDKTQFLLDATLGFINIEQNDIFRVLTVVSVVGIPPTLIAGIYGMNFKGMPELEWTYGYWYGLAVIVLSGLLPLLWCRRRGWL